MDEITAPRRSTHPSQLRRPPQTRRLSSGDVPLAEYVVASGVDLPRLKLFTRVSQDLQNWVDESKAVYKQAEDEAAKLTPELFREYSQADEEGRDQLLVCCFFLAIIGNACHSYRFLSASTPADEGQRERKGQIRMVRLEAEMDPRSQPSCRGEFRQT